MLPSMPILFTRDSQDAFGNKIEPSTSFFNQHSFVKPAINPELFQPPPPKTVQVPPVAPVSPKVPPKETKGKSVAKKKDQAKEPPAKPENALEIALVKSYYTKVQSRFSSHPTVPTNKFVQFQLILKSFNPTKETPVDLYKKIEQLFGEEHKDFVEEFLLFMKPGQAAEVGRFMDHFMLVQMTSFIEMLQITFARKPTVLRKVLRSLTTSINSGSSQEMKTRVLPHLRSHPRLIHMFKALFEDERLPDSLYETGVETLNESFLTSDNGCDMWEFEGESDNKRNLEAKETLDTMYLHGRLFLQHGRMLRSARVTYPYSKEPYRVHARRLAPNHFHLSPSESDEERTSPKRQNKNASKIPTKRTKKQLKSPTKNVKDVNDNTSNVTNSPKTGRKQTNRSKTFKEKKEECKLDAVKKKEKGDSKNQTCKKDEKGKQAKVEVVSTVDAVDTTPNVEFAPSVEVAPNVDVTPTVEVKKEVKSNWTRDEDKTMLQILKGEAGSEQIFCRIRELLPHRSVTEIKERFCHVMNLLQQMAVEIT